MTKKVRKNFRRQNHIRSNGGKKKNTNVPKLLVHILLIIFIGYALVSVSTLVRRTYALKNSDKLSQEASERLLIDREGLKSDLILLKSSHDSAILGAWVVVSNEKIGSTLVYYIPPWVYLRDYSGAFEGYVSVGDLAYAGEVLDPSREIEYAIWQLSNLSGIPIDSYLWIDEDGVNEYSSIFGDISEFSEARYATKYTGAKDAPVGAYLLHSFVDRFSYSKLLMSSSQWEDLSKNVYSNMGAGEIVSQISRLKGLLNAGGVIMFDLSQPWAGREIAVGADRNITVVNYPVLDENFDRYTNIVRGREIEREQVKVEVYNASGIPEIAYRYARKLRNSGIGVVRYENAPEVEERTKVYITRPEAFESSLDLVKRILVLDAEIINARPSFITTGDIVILLGTDMQGEIDWK